MGYLVEDNNELTQLDHQIAADLRARATQNSLVEADPPRSEAELPEPDAESRNKAIFAVIILAVLAFCAAVLLSLR